MINDQANNRRVKIFLSHVILVLFFIVMMFCSSASAETARSGVSVDFSRGALKVHSSKRFLVHEDGSFFFYLGDTAWELFHRLNREEAEKYLENRRQKGFTVIQAVALAELDGLNTPNAYNHRPLHDNDPARPNEDYFRHVDFIVKTAGQKGIYIGMLPTWGDKVSKAWGVGPVIFENEDDGYVFGKYLGGRYKDAPNIIWILGGDRIADGRENIWRAMAAGIEEGDKGRHLMTYHPQGGRSSADWFHDDQWLDFNMLQSGHSELDNDNYNQIGKDYRRTPVKPCMDGEPRYENHCIAWNPEKGWFNDFDVRQAAYWSLFAGSFGHTYGCHDIWQMAAPGRTAISSARNFWYDVLDLPGAWDMMHVRHLMESRPFARVPDQSLICGESGDSGEHIQVTRSESYAMVYLPYGQTVKVNLGIISGTRVRTWWFDPRSGEAQLISVRENKGVEQFDPPGEADRGNDWILVLDDDEQKFPPPGSVKLD